MSDIIKTVLSGTDIVHALPPVLTNPLVEIPGKTGDGTPAKMQLTVGQLCTGTAVVGKTGIGKTYLSKRLLHQLRDNLTGPYTMVVVVAKNNYRDMMRDGDLVLGQGMNGENVVEWNLYREILADGYDSQKIELNTAELISSLFAYKKNSKDVFFVEAASLILQSIIKSQIREGIQDLDARQKWTNKSLRSFFASFKEEDFRRLLEKANDKGIVEKILGNDSEYETALGVWAEMITTLMRILVDSFAKEGDFSIREFVAQKNRHCLFILYDQTYSEIQVPLYATLIKLLLKECLSQSATTGHTILYCDEIAVMGQTDIANAVNLGRELGLIPICGFQSIAQLKDIFGEEKAVAMLAGLCNKICFQPGESETRKYIREEFGENTVEELRLSAGGTGGRGVSKEWMLDDVLFNSLSRGDCIVKDADSNFYMFHAD